MKKTLATLFASAGILVALSGIAAAWAQPGATPPNSNSGAPLNLGAVDQTKNATIGLNGLAVFGNAILQASAYLNWGATSGTNGYGVRDNAGTLEFKNSGGSWQSLATIITNTASGQPWTTVGNDIHNTNAGNVGIKTGATAPTGKLTISNNVATGFLDTYAEYQTILYDSGTAGPSYGLGIKGNTMVFNSGAGAYSFDKGGASTLLAMDTAGLVGIGSTPATMLDVNKANTTVANIQTTLSSNAIGVSSLYSAGSTYVPGLIWYDTNDNATRPKAGIFSFPSSSGTYIHIGTSNSYVTGVTNTGLNVNYAGTVGASTASPNSGLQIGAGSTGNIDALTIYSNAPAIYLRNSNSYKSAIIYENSNLLYFMSAPTAAPGGGNNWTTPANGYYPLYLNMTNNDAVFGAYVYGFNFYYSSDGRLKENIKPLKDGLANLLRLNPVSFTWKKDSPLEGKNDLGFIAQDVEQVFPNLVHENDKGQKAVDYMRLTPVLVAAVQDQEKQLDQIEQKVKSIKSGL